MLDADHERRLMEQFGRRLRAARIASGCESAEDLAVKIGTEPEQYRKYERGESFPSLPVLKAIVEKTKTTSDWLLFGSE
jgi:transcriptional regulator with XRE-family HTH domain